MYVASSRGTGIAAATPNVARKSRLYWVDVSSGAVVGRAINFCAHLQTIPGRQGWWQRRDRNPDTGPFLKFRQDDKASTAFAHIVCGGHGLRIVGQKTPRRSANAIARFHSVAARDRTRRDPGLWSLT